MRLCCALLMLTIGCHSGREQPPDDLGKSTADLAQPSTDLDHPSGDLGAVSASDLAVCENFVPAAVPVSIEIIGGASGVRDGLTNRVRLSYDVHAGCELPMPLTTTLYSDDPLNEAVIGGVQRLSSVPCGAISTASFIWEIDQTTILHDAATGNTVDITLAPDTGSDCTIVAAGQACARNCQCPTNTACLTVGGGVTLCGQSCTQDIDCPTQMQCDAAGGYLCAPATICRVDADCTAGQRAIDCVCSPAPLPHEGQNCRCDSDCSYGDVCRNGCEHACVTNADCDLPGSDSVLVSCGAIGLDTANYCDNF